MRKTIIFLLVSFAVALFAKEYERTNACEEPQNKPKDQLFRLLGVEIIDVKDLNDIQAFVASVPKRRVRITLANILPYSGWPDQLSKEEKKIKEGGLELLKAMILQKKTPEILTFWGIDAGHNLHGDLTYREAGGPYTWNPNLPAGKLGWFIIHINAMLIENGFAVYSEDPKPLRIPVVMGSSVERFLDRPKLLLAAEKYAMEKAKGIWGVGKDGEFGKRLQTLAASREAK